MEDLKIVAVQRRVQALSHIFVFFFFSFCENRQ